MYKYVWRKLKMGYNFLAMQNWSLSESKSDIKSDSFFNQLWTQIKLIIIRLNE